MDGSSPSGVSGYVNAYAYNANGAENGNGHPDYPVEGQVPSPIESRSEKSISRKRSFARRDSPSDEEETPARRQEDDVTPKLKRRQPKVAAAYRQVVLSMHFCKFSNGVQSPLVGAVPWVTALSACFSCFVQL